MRVTVTKIPSGINEDNLYDVFDFLTEMRFNSALINTKVTDARPVFTVTTSYTAKDWISNMCTSTPQPTNFTYNIPSSNNQYINLEITTYA